MGHTEIVKILAPLTDDPNAPDKNGDTPIHHAANEGYTKIVKILAPLTDNPNAPNKNGSTPVQDAAWHGHPNPNAPPVSRVWCPQDTKSN